MSSAVLVLTLLLVFDPVRLGLLLLLISRPRPLPSLFAYWVGAMAVSVPYMLGPLTLLHVIPAFRSFAEKLATPATFTSPTVRHVQIGIGVLALSIAALMVVRFRARQRAQLLTPSGTISRLVPDSTAPAAALPFGRADSPAEGGSAIRRLRSRARKAWENGSSWPGLILGAVSGPPPLTILLVLTTVMASGAGIGAQVGFAIAWVVGMFAVVEIILVSHLAAPAKTQAVLQLVHNWVLTYRRQILVAMFAVVGAAMLAQGTNSI